PAMTVPMKCRLSKVASLSCQGWQFQPNGGDRPEIRTAMTPLLARRAGRSGGLLWAQRLDQGCERIALLACKIGEGRTNGTGGVPDDAGARLHDAHRITSRAIPNIQIGQEEGIEKGAGRFLVTPGQCIVELHRRA